MAWLHNSRFPSRKACYIVGCFLFLIYSQITPKERVLQSRFSLNVLHSGHVVVDHSRQYMYLTSEIIFDYLLQLISKLNFRPILTKFGVYILLYWYHLKRQGSNFITLSQKDILLMLIFIAGDLVHGMDIWWNTMNSVASSGWLLKEGGTIDRVVNK